MQITRIAFVLVVACSLVARADDLSGPKTGTAVSPLKVFAATGEKAGQELDYAAERGEKPTVYVFVQHERFDRPLARMLRALEKAAAVADRDYQVIVVYLTDDEAKTKEHLPRIQMSMQFASTALVVYPSATMGPEGWSVNTDAQLTVVVVKKAKTTASFGYRSANETVVKEIAPSLK
jgi:hypothetical protein